MGGELNEWECGVSGWREWAKFVYVLTDEMVGI